MQTWWDASPYWGIGIYIGGATRRCTQPNLTSSWVTAVNNQQWGFLPIWAGRQAPCLSSDAPISYDPTTAYNQGIAEADSAMSTGSSLEFTTGTMIVADLEAYDTTNSSCRTAVKYYVSGWDREFKAKASWGGAYGSSCGSAPSDWATLPVYPANIWLAQYNDSNTVWNVSCVSNGYWNYDQRHHQYHGTHTETWGGVSLSIDNDCANGSMARSTESGDPDTGVTEGGANDPIEDPSC